MKQKIKKIALAIMCVIVCASITLTMCFADSYVIPSTPMRIEVNNAPTSMLIYRALDGVITPMQCGNPFVFSDGVLPHNVYPSQGNAQYLAMVSATNGVNTNLSIYSQYTYVHELDSSYSIITSIFTTANNDYSLNDGYSRSLAMQLYYKNCYFYDEVNPTIDIYLNGDYSDEVTAYVTYRYYGVNTDGNLVLNTTTKEVPYDVVVEGSSYRHVLNFTNIFSHVDYNDGYPIGDGEALVEQMYVDINFSKTSAEYSNAFGVRFNHSQSGTSDVSFNEKIRELSNYDTNAEEKPLAEWAFDAIENIIDYPLFYVGDVRVTPIAIFSLVFGLGLFAWLLKVFAGG